MALLMQLDGPRPPALMGLWSDVTRGLRNVFVVERDDIRNTWRTIRGQPLSDTLIPSTFNPSPAFMLVLGVGLGVFLASRKGS